MRLYERVREGAGKAAGRAKGSAGNELPAVAEQHQRDRRLHPSGMWQPPYATSRVATRERPATGGQLAQGFLEDLVQAPSFARAVRPPAST